MLRPTASQFPAAQFSARMVLGAAVTLLVLLLAGEAVRRFPTPVRQPDLRSALTADYRPWSWTEFGAIDQAILSDILRDRRAPRLGWVESDAVWDYGPGQAPGMLEATVGPTLVIPTSAQDTGALPPAPPTATPAVTRLAGQPTLPLVFTPTPGPVTAIAVIPTARETSTLQPSATSPAPSPTPLLPTPVRSRTPSPTAVASLTPTRTVLPSATPPAGSPGPTATVVPPSPTASETVPPATGMPPSATPNPTTTSLPHTATASATATEPPATATASATLTPSLTPTEPVTCRVSYVVRSITYGSVNTTSVALDFWNDGPTTITGWTLTWQFGNTETLYALVGGSYTQVGQAVSVRNGPTNGTIFPGGQVALSFDAFFTDPLTLATAFALNGSPCSVNYGPTPTPVMPTQTPTATPSPTPAGAPAACTVDFSQTGGVPGAYYQVTVEIHNQGSALSAWHLTWTWNGDERITGVSGASLTQVNANVTVFNIPSEPLAAGALRAFNLVVDYESAGGLPGNVRLNGTLCTLTGSVP